MKYIVAIIRLFFPFFLLKIEAKAPLFKCKDKYLFTLYRVSDSRTSFYLLKNDYSGLVADRYQERQIYNFLVNIQECLNYLDSGKIEIEEYIYSSISFLGLHAPYKTDKYKIYYMNYLLNRKSKFSIFEFGSNQIEIYIVGDGLHYESLKFVIIMQYYEDPQAKFLSKSSLEEAGAAIQSIIQTKK
jgi:hypothetical protein